jgi:hypothetical protein
MLPKDHLDGAWLTFFRDLYLGFGPPEELLHRCVDRAYRDFNRTWHIGPHQAQSRPVIRSSCCETLITALLALNDHHTDPALYNRWHSKLIRKLTNASDPLADGSGLTVGQAQKWINMSVKYTVGGRLPGFERFEQCAHMPIDRIILKELSSRPRFKPAVDLLPNGPWSRLADAGAYKAFQRKMRELAAPQAPLMLELTLWMRAQGRSLRSAGPP